MAGPALAATLIWGTMALRKRSLNRQAEDDDLQRDVVIDQMLAAPAVPGQPALMPWMHEAAAGLREISRADTIKQLGTWREELRLREERLSVRADREEDNLRAFEKAQGTDAASVLARDSFNQELKLAGIEQQSTVDEAARQARILADPDFAESEAVRLKGGEAKVFPVEMADGVIDLVPIRGTTAFNKGVDQLNQSGRLLETINDSFSGLVSGLNSGDPAEAAVLEFQSAFTEIFLIMKGEEFLQLGAPQQADIELGERFMSMDATSMLAQLVSNPEAIMGPLSRLTSFVGETVAVQLERQQNWRGRPDATVQRATDALTQAGINQQIGQGVIEESQRRLQVINETAKATGTFLIDDRIAAEFAPERFPDSVNLINQLEAQGVDTSTLLSPENNAQLNQLTRLFATNPVEAIGLAIAIVGLLAVTRGKFGLQLLRGAGTTRAGLTGAEKVGGATIAAGLSTAGIPTGLEALQ